MPEERRGQTARSRIMEAAIQRFALDGYGATSVQRIADDAGMSKQALMHHFRTKEALRKAVFETLEHRWQQALPTLVAAAAGDGGFESALDHFVALMDEDPLVMRLVMRELIDRPEVVREWLERTWWPWMRVASDLASGMHSAKLPPDLDVEAHVSAVAALLLFVVGIPPISHGDGDDPNAWRKRVIRAAVQLAREGSRTLIEEASSPSA